jgi:hypothetical protein
MKRVPSISSDHEPLKRLRNAASRVVDQIQKQVAVGNLTNDQIRGRVMADALSQWVRLMSLDGAKFVPRASAWDPSTEDTFLRMLSMSLNDTRPYDIVCVLRVDRPVDEGQLRLLFELYNHGGSVFAPGGERRRQSLGRPQRDMQVYSRSYTDRVVVWAGHSSEIPSYIASCSLVPDGVWYEVMFEVVLSERAMLKGLFLARDSTERSWTCVSRVITNIHSCLVPRGTELAWSFQDIDVGGVAWSDIILVCDAGAVSVSVGDTLDVYDFWQLFCLLGDHNRDQTGTLSRCLVWKLARKSMYFAVYTHGSGVVDIAVFED